MSAVTVSVIYHEGRNSKPSVGVNLRDGCQIAIKPWDELCSPVLIMHEQASVSFVFRIPINARWSFWMRGDFQKFRMLTIGLHEGWSRRTSSFETNDVNLGLWRWSKSVSALWSGFQWTRGVRPERGKMSKNSLVSRRIMLETNRSSLSSF